MSGNINEYACHMPAPDTPMVDVSTGVPSTAWWLWAMTIFRRTGTQIGANVLTVADQASAALAAATAAVAAVGSRLPLSGGTMTGPIVLPIYTVATLPVGATGATAMVSDALAPAFGAPVVGGGTVRVPVFFNLTTWTVG